MDEHSHHKIGKEKTHMIVAYKEADDAFILNGIKSLQVSGCHYCTLISSTPYSG
jgi:hypothetical protein